MKGIKLKLALFSLLTTLSGVSYAETGMLVTITESGVTIAATVITVCLNAQDLNHPLNCQNHTVTHASFEITPVNTEQNYLHAGVKVPQGSGFTFQTAGSNCVQGSGDYCLFTVSHANPKTINASSTTVAVGQPRDGGVIACLAGDGGGFNLIASSADNYGGVGVLWSQTTDMPVPAPGATSPTDGATNTANAYTQNFNAPSAIQICSDLNEGGYNDWYLPAKDELNCLYINNRALEDAGAGFATEFYWSSTESDDLPSDNAFSQNFTDGTQGGDNKNIRFKVRCVRAFTP